MYHQITDINRTLVGNKTVDHSDVAGASPVDARLNTWFQWIGQRKLQDETRNIKFRDLVHMCRFVLQNGALWDMELVRCGICATGL